MNAAPMLFDRKLNYDTGIDQTLNIWIKHYDIELSTVHLDWDFDLRVFYHCYSVRAKLTSACDRTMIWSMDIKRNTLKTQM